MPDDVEKFFIRSFVGYLKQKISSRTLAPDAQESVEVAMQCLQAAFECEDAEGGAATTEPAAAASESVLKEVDLFEMYQSAMIERNPETVKLAEQIKNNGNQLMKDGKYNEALLQYNRAIAFDPKNPIFYCNRAAAFIRLGDNERAITDCKSALVYNQNYGKAYGRLGIAFSNLGRYDEAQQAYTKAIELEPDNQDYRTNLEVARNAATQPMPQVAEGLSQLINNPALNNLMSSAGLDMGQLHNMAQNPMVMNAVMDMLGSLRSNGNPLQAFVGVAGAAAGNAAADGAGGQAPAELMQFIQNMAAQLSSRAPGGGGAGANNQQNNQPQPPPST